MLGLVGFGHPDAWGNTPKRLFDYDNDPENPKVSTVANISPYLVQGTDSVVVSRGAPICPVPPIAFGSMPNDGGNLLLSPAEKDALLEVESAAAPFIRPFLGSEEFINGLERWCLWLKDASPAQLRNMPHVLKRVEAVRAARAGSSREATRKLAAYPTLFGEDRQPTTRYLLIPRVSSERRPFVPVGFLEADIIAGDAALIVPTAGVFHLGILSSSMHMAWMRQVAGRLKSDYRYSNKLVYNNFPWPMDATDEQKAKVEQAAQAVLDARAAYPGSTLADLYDPNTMPPALAKAHEQLDRAVEKCYRPEPFGSDRERVEYLFARYGELAATRNA